MALSQNEWRHARIQVPLVAAAGLPFKQRRRRRRFAVGENHALRRRLNKAARASSNVAASPPREPQARPTLNAAGADSTVQPAPAALQQHDQERAGTVQFGEIIRT
ncbi:hypothetical protein [Lysobacter enzymogenes]|uniref:hypothetical protein n=1 Tax=Lysobacter enzymogenes TaxID=69 RepID=UPI0011AB80BE|nr:hypothetical protein [Lysobacter enzymogenes]